MKEPAAAGLYETDYHAWTQQQAAALKRGDFAAIDLPNLIEEVESLGRSEERELESRLAQLMMHLLKWQFQPMQRSRSWMHTIEEQRHRLSLLFKRMPSLRPLAGEFATEAYSDARMMAERDTGLMINTFPKANPYAIEQMLDPSWLPPGDVP